MGGWVGDCKKVPVDFVRKGHSGLRLGQYSSPPLTTLLPIHIPRAASNRPPDALDSGVRGLKGLGRRGRAHSDRTAD
jgi:hypothetical protein